jgi:magnesium-transporting ATPase (P-type)
MGKEGNQAASFSDYALVEFRSLRRLIFWHGRNFGTRVCDFICWNIFKNMAFSNMLWAYNVYAGYSGWQMLDDVYYAVYNILLSVTAMGMTMLSDQDAPFSKSATTEPGLPGDYDKETCEIGYSIAEYYLFSRNNF